ncbi:MAG: Ig-like domain-containing protein [Micropruina sp.]|uniref:Ig-like domain-containing protein n=1 Tax=Micropruina sp. TaxID=2737536 RepID=UPI0039E4B57B
MPTTIRLLKAALACVVLVASSVLPQPAQALPAPVLPAALRPADSSPNVQPAPVLPDSVTTSAGGQRVEIYGSIGNLDRDNDWRPVNAFAYLVSSVPKYQHIYATVYNAFWDGQLPRLDPVTNKWAIYGTDGKPVANPFSPTTAFMNQLNQYDTDAERKQYIHTIGNRITIKDSLANNSSLATLLNKAGVLKLCNNGWGACLSRVKESLFHDKFALFSQAKDSTGKLWDNVLWVTSSNLNGASGGGKSNISFAIYGDAAGYQNVLQNLWEPSMNQTVTPGFTQGASKGFASSSSDIAYYPSPRTTDFEGDLLGSQTNAKLKGKKTSCKVYVVHSLFSMARRKVADALAALKKDGCSVKVVVGPPSVKEITDTYFAMSKKLRSLISHFEFGNVHDKTVTLSYTLNGAKRSYAFGGSANLNGTSLSGDELAVRFTNTEVVGAVETRSQYVFTMAKAGTRKIPVVKVKLSPVNPTVVTGSKLTMKATVLPTNATVRTLNWRSSDSSVARVDSSGNVTTLKPGIATISAISVSGSKVGSSTIMVTPASARTNDFDGDGVVDRAIVHRGTDSERGSIEIRYGNGNKENQVVRPSSLGFGESAAIHYNQVVAADVNTDGYADLVVGAPAENAVDGTETGRAYVIYGSSTGLKTSTVKRLTSPVASAEGASGPSVGGFGTAVAVVNSPHPVILVGDPWAKTATGLSGGLVHAFPVTNGTFGTPVAISQDSPGVPGVDEPGDEFGYSLASSGANLLVGSPGETIGSKARAGSVLLFRFAGTGYKSTGYNQDSPGVPDGTETGDRFGLTLSMDGSHAVIGIPNESVGKLRDAGAIQPMTISATGSVSWPGMITQNSKGVPGAAEAGDLFGSTVQVARQCSGKPSYLVGVPGEDLGTGADRGLVQLIPQGITSSCKLLEYTNGTGRLGGAALANEKVPGSLSVLRSSPSAKTDTLVIGTRFVLHLFPAPFTKATGWIPVSPGDYLVGPLQ